MFDAHYYGDTSITKVQEYSLLEHFKLNSFRQLFILCWDLHQCSASAAPSMIDTKFYADVSMTTVKQVKEYSIWKTLT